MAVEPQKLLKNSTSIGAQFAARCGAEDEELSSLILTSSR